ncbi:MAG: glycine/betaine/sarcosine/D-proline family reductase selenoprotein B [Deltaproteobacteria bacterium]|nr:glycine/betaine/sarcosine/D-proline family reductase selenoprotein B [Deltaproteobacteria bacterium]
MESKGLKERIITRLFSRFPFIAERWAESYQAVESSGIPWTPFTGDLAKCKVALVTTAGVHMKDQPPFDMDDEEGDFTFREISARAGVEDLMITHKYYDHTGADKDINIVFPLERLREMAKRGEIGELAPRHYGFMGHIVGNKIDSLIHETAPEVAGKLRADGADIALLTPG